MSGVYSREVVEGGEGGRVVGCVSLRTKGPATGLEMTIMGLGFVVL